MKYEWRKQGKALYGARTAPALKTVPAQNYIKIDGRGDPNGADFSNRVGALYALAYAVKAAYKAATSPSARWRASGHKSVGMIWKKTSWNTP